MAAFTSAQNGNWSTPATWGAATYPKSGDTATVQLGHTVTLTQTERARGLSLDGTLRYSHASRLILEYSFNSGSDAAITKATGADSVLEFRLLTDGGTLATAGAQTFDYFSAHSAGGLIVISLGTIIGVLKQFRSWTTSLWSNHAVSTVTFDVAGDAVAFGGQLKRIVIASGVLHAYGTKDEAGNTGVDFRLGRRRPMHRMARGCMVGTGLARN